MKVSYIQYRNQTESKSKYKNIKTTIDGITFDSKKEAKRYTELKQLKERGDVLSFECQTPFELIPKMKDKFNQTYRKTTYRADFVVVWNNGITTVEDVKGMKTEVYKLKKKLMLFLHGISIVEI